MCTKLLSALTNVHKTTKLFINCAQNSEVVTCALKLYKKYAFNSSAKVDRKVKKIIKCAQNSNVVYQM